jgi:predicted ATPase
MIRRLENHSFRKGFSELGGYGAVESWSTNDSGIQLSISYEGLDPLPSNSTTDSGNPEPSGLAPSRVRPPIGKELEVVPGLLDYNCLFERSGAAFYVASETLSQRPTKPDQTKSCPPGITSAPEDIFHRSGNKMEYCDRKGFLHQEAAKLRTKQVDECESILNRIEMQREDVAQFLGRVRLISIWNVAALNTNGDIRKPQPLELAEIPDANGGSLLSVLYRLKTDDSDLYASLVETLQTVFPELERIELPLAGKGFVSLAWYQRGFSKPFDAQQLSDGTLRLLWLVTLLYTVPDDGLVLIDEPEISMHPQWLQFLAGLFRQMSARTQIIVSTHSDQLIRWAQPEELLLLDMEDGQSRFRWGDDPDLALKDWLQDYTLDQLWLMGELGARR